MYRASRIPPPAQASPPHGDSGPRNVEGGGLRGQESSTLARARVSERASGERRGREGGSGSEGWWRRRRRETGARARRGGPGKEGFRGGRAEGGGGREGREWALAGPLDIYALDEAKAASQQGFNVLPSPPLHMPIFLLRRPPLVSSTSCAPFAER